MARGIHDQSRRSVRVETTLRPPHGLTDDDLVDYLIRQLQESNFGVDVISVKELGDYDPLAGDDD